MSDEIDITRGGALVVDTQSLVDLAGRLQLSSASLAQAEDAVQSAQQSASMASFAGLSGERVFGLHSSAEALARLREDVEETARSVQRMAEVYELVELRVQAQFAFESCIPLPPSVHSRWEELRTPEREEAADALLTQWQEDSTKGLFLPSVFGRFFGLDPLVALGGVTTALGRGGRGVLPPGARLMGAADPVRLIPVVPPQPQGPPESLADSMSRLPSVDDAQLRVERYTMPDGPAQYVLYIGGTRSALWGGEEPWDLKSNTYLYNDLRSESYQAAEDALAAAGAEPGDVVHLWGYSQGGMIASRLAMEEVYDVRTLITAGSPVEPSVAPETLTVQLRHTDDPVSALSGGGTGAGTGSADSIVVQREGDQAMALHDLWLHAHLSPQYLETAKQADASGDVRLDALAAVWDELGRATSVEATEYRAERE